LLPANLELLLGCAYSDKECLLMNTTGVALHAAVQNHRLDALPGTFRKKSDRQLASLLQSSARDWNENAIVVFQSIVLLNLAAGRIEEAEQWIEKRIMQSLPRTCMVLHFIGNALLEARRETALRAFLKLFRDEKDTDIS